jgi:hypothetical protein
MHGNQVKMLKIYRKRITNTKLLIFSSITSGQNTSSRNI